MDLVKSRKKKKVAVGDCVSLPTSYRGSLYAKKMFFRRTISPDCSVVSQSWTSLIDFQFFGTLTGKQVKKCPLTYPSCVLYLEDTPHQKIPSPIASPPPSTDDTRIDESSYDMIIERTENSPNQILQQDSSSFSVQTSKWTMYIQTMEVRKQSRRAQRRSKEADKTVKK